MKKVLGKMAGIFFAVFSIAVLGLLMSFTMGALRKLFPDSFTNQMWGLVLFDIAAMIWGLTFVYKSESVGQYAASGIGFITGFVGTLLMVTFEVITSGQTFVQDTGDLGRWAVYGFILVTAVHSALVYFFHASDPEVHAKINVGIARGEIVTEAITQATNDLERDKSDLAQSTRQKIVDDVKRDLHIPLAVDPKVGFVPASSIPYPVQSYELAQTQPKNRQSFFAKVKNTFSKPKQAETVRNEQTVVDMPELKETKQDTTQQEDGKPEDKSFPVGD